MTEQGEATVYMRTEFCPIVVFCIESTASAVGDQLAKIAGARSPSAPFSLWSVRAQGDGYEFLPVGSSRTGVLPQAQPNSIPDIQPNSIPEIVDAVIAEALSLGDLRITRMQEHAMGLRIILLAAATEMQTTALTNLITAFHSVAQRHLGGRYLTEACFLLPDLALFQFQTGEYQPGGTAVENLLDVIEATPCVPFSSCVTASFSYCWWLGRINACGLTLPPLPRSTLEIATALYGLLTTPPDRLPYSPAVRDGRLQHMSMGYGELFVSREKLLEYLTAQHMCHLIQAAFLDNIHHVEHKRIRRRAWEFSKSSGCRQILDEVGLTLGRKRIWTGFNAGATSLRDENDVEACILSVTDHMHRFFDMELQNLVSTLEASLRSRCDLLLAEINGQIRSIAEHAKGGLFEALKFLEEMAAFLPETSDLAEGEIIMNLQQIRRSYDCAAAEMMHRKYVAFPADGRKLGKSDLRLQIRHLERLHNISSPPALQPETWDALRWSEGGLRGSSLSARIADLKAQLRSREKSTAQEYVRTEHELQEAHYEFLAECERRETEIVKTENELRQTAMECRKLVTMLNGLRRIKLGPWTFQLHRRAAKQMNEQLAHLRTARLPSQYRQFVAAVESRVQLSVNRVIYEARDRLIQDAIEHVRDLNQRISQTIETLNRTKDDFSSIGMPTQDQLLERSLLTESEIQRLLQVLLQSHLEPLDLPSTWGICFQTAQEIIKQLKALARRPFEAVQEWRFEDLAQRLRPTRTRLEALAAWLAQASQPLFRPMNGDIGLCLIQGVERSELGRTLRNVLPDADWIEDSAISGVVVRQFQEITDLSLIHQRLRFAAERESEGPVSAAKKEPVQTSIPTDMEAPDEASNNYQSTTWSRTESVEKHTDLS